MLTGFALPPGPKKLRFVAYAGFAKGKGAVNTAKFEVPFDIVRLTPGPPVPAQLLQSSTVTHPIGGVPQPMQKLEYTFDSNVYGPGLYLLLLKPKIEGGELDADHPPALFGARFIPVP